MLEARPRSSFLITKVKGHASHRDVKKGLVKLADKVGNDAADYLASAGAAEHAPAPEIVHKTKLRQAVAEEVQKLMLDIVVARGPRAMKKVPVRDAAGSRGGDTAFVVVRSAPLGSSPPSSHLGAGSFSVSAGIPSLATNEAASIIRIASVEPESHILSDLPSYSGLSHPIQMCGRGVGMPQGAWSSPKCPHKRLRP